MYEDKTVIEYSNSADLYPTVLFIFSENWIVFKVNEVGLLLIGIKKREYH